ncbi:MAG: tRNA preQ1(34) S-adenosylmethionine ribosyltransferase-isomerase QueA [Burkholderiales bacterium]|jgi:S-adenosylmethionine:tRNA ribosyltransferase-isomerase|nr:tRNA preQ1(34) S-adenosylmethionine ribosyltransferase-isomerase QueA [Burkholderiales bacterium]
MNMQLNDFDYDLPEGLIAKEPSAKRDSSRLLIPCGKQLTEKHFSDIVDYINKDDLLVFNNSRVIKARLLGNKPSGGKIEILVERILDDLTIIAHVRSNKTIQVGLIVLLPDNVKVQVIETLNGLFKLKFEHSLNIIQFLDKFGHIPLPPYINRADNNLDAERYQTVYAKSNGSVAAPTAGLHFSTELLDKVKQKGIQTAFITLHVGSGTFKPVSVNNIEQHKMHSEYYNVEEKTIELIKQVRNNGGKIIAVGTTTLRTLETIANNDLRLRKGETDIFITPGYKFKLVDKLITNFHLPKSTLLMLVSAFAGMDNIKNAYRYAIENEYRFFSYGDAMLLSRME